MNNALSVFFGFAAQKGWGIGKVFEKISEFVSQNHMLGFIVFIMFLILLCYIAYCLVRFMLSETVKNRFEKRKEMFAKFAIREKYLADIDRLKSENAPAKAEMVLPANEEEFMRFVENNVEQVVRSAAEEIDKKKFKMDKRSKIFLIASIVLSGAMTIFTFVWGLL